jgi:hypothetical protein
VREFAAAKDKAAKDRWASRYIPEDARAELIPLDRFGNGLLLGRNEPGFGVIGLRTMQLVCNGCSGGSLPMPDGLQQASNSFFELWLARQDVPRAREFFDVRSMKTLLRGTNIQSDADVAGWIDRFLTIQLVLDHDRVDTLGHGDPRVAGYSELPLRPSDPGWQVRRTATINLSAFTFVEEPSVGWIVAVRDTAVTNDVVGMAWQRVSGRWKITRAVASPRW